MEELDAKTEMSATKTWWPMGDGRDGVVAVLVREGVATRVASTCLRIRSLLLSGKSAKFVSTEAARFQAVHVSVVIFLCVVADSGIVFIGTSDDQFITAFFHPAVSTAAAEARKAAGRSL